MRRINFQFPISFICLTLSTLSVRADAPLPSSEEQIISAITNHLQQANFPVDDSLSPEAIAQTRKKQIEQAANIQQYQNLVTQQSWSEIRPDPQGTEQSIAVTAEIWTAAIQSALDQNKIVYIPHREKPYYIDAPLIIHSGNHLVADENAEIRLKPGSNCCMVRNEHIDIEKNKPVDVSDNADKDILIDGGIWTTLATTGRQSNGNTNGFADKEGTIKSHGTIVLNNIRKVQVRNLTIRQCRTHGVQMSRCSTFLVENIRFEEHRRDGVHINGPAHWGIIRHISGETFDDMVGLLPWDWKHTAIGFGSIDHILIQDVTRSDPSAIRLLPGTKLYPDGQKVPCDIINVVFQNIKGITEYKMYDQPNLELGRANDFADPIGNLYNVYFRQIELIHPTPEPPFQIALNADNLSIQDVLLHFNPDTPELVHYEIVQVGPKSMTIKFDPGNPAHWVEVFSPDQDCVVKNFELTNVRARYDCDKIIKEKILDPFRVVSVISQKPNPDYPNSIPKGGIGRGVLFWKKDITIHKEIIREK
jgi:hypothetical protein